MVNQEGQSGKVDRRLQALERQRRALELRKSGLSYDEIAQRLGYSSPSGAFRAVTKALHKAIREPARELIDLECERLDVALAAIWPAVVAGKVQAIDRLISIMDRRAKLLGLDSPQKQEADIGETLARILEGLAHQDGPSND